MLLGRGRLQETRGRDGLNVGHRRHRWGDYGHSGKLRSMEDRTHAASVGGATMLPGVKHRVHKQHEAPRQGERGQPHSSSCVLE